MIEATTKPTGSGSDWLEVGAFEVDEFGDKIWKPTAERYPNKDTRLKVKRDYDGRGASQRIYWKIIVPDGYDKMIVCKSGNGVDSILYDPNDLPKT